MPRKKPNPAHTITCKTCLHYFAYTMTVVCVFSEPGAQGRQMPGAQYWQKMGFVDFVEKSFKLLTCLSIAHQLVSVQCPSFHR